jgi:hypothetical protein
MKQHLRVMFSAQARKAIVAAVVAGAAAVVAAGGHYTLVNVLGIAGAILGAWQATYWTSNAYPAINLNGFGDPPNKGVDARTQETFAPNPPASATPIHDTMVAEYTAAPEPTP